LSDLTIEKWRKACLTKLGSVEETPFGPEALVYKVSGKMFALIGVKAPLSMNLKCDPQEATMLRDIFEAVIPGYHMNKKHWNTVILNNSIPDGEIERMIDNSYALVLKGMTKKMRASLEIAYSPEHLYGKK